MFAFDLTKPASHEHNVHKVAALELALGCSLPDDFDDWPLGLTTEWHFFTKCAAEPLKRCKTLGHVARCYLTYREARLSGLKSSEILDAA